MRRERTYRAAPAWIALASDGTHTIAAEMDEVRCKGLHRVQVRDRQGKLSEAVLELKYRRIRVRPPIGKQRRYPDLTLTVLHATERATPRGRDKIDGKLITDLPVGSRAEAVEKLQWYALRWKIEVFHKILKSGCKAEISKLRTAERLVNLLADILRAVLANLLAHDGESLSTGCFACARVHATRNPTTRPTRERQQSQQTSAPPIRFTLPHSARATRGLSCPRQ